MRCMPLTLKTSPKTHKNPTSPEKNKKYHPLQKKKIIPKQSFCSARVFCSPIKQCNTTQYFYNKIFNIQHVYGFVVLPDSKQYYFTGKEIQWAVLGVDSGEEWMAVFPVKIPCTGNPELHCFISDSKADISQVLLQTKHGDVWSWMFFPLFSTRHLSKLKCQSISNHGCVLAERE